MHVLLLCTTFNSLTQAIYVALQEKGYSPKVLYSVDMDKIPELNPELILCPFMKDFIPSNIYENYPTFILHPGPRGDRGPNALEHALERSEWGVVWLKANAEYDGGDIYAEVGFRVRATYKTSLYRQEVTRAALEALEMLLENIAYDRCVPQVLNPLHERFTQQRRKIDWQNDTTDMIIQKIRQGDSYPGVLDEILGVKCYLFGAWREEKLGSNASALPKQVLAKRDGAICLKTIDGAVWISHLKEPYRFKLPVTYVLKERLAGVKEERLPLLFDKRYETFYETSVEMRDEVAYLYFNFHNGAMSATQSIRLKYCVDYLKEQCKVLVLVGGMDFFSNGIHLNILEDSKKQGEDGWANINAMNDLVRSILFADEIVTVASLARNAGAGGVFMALACDFVVAREGIVLNPHYKTLGLTGSEYHTYTLPKRVGEENARALLEECLPISAHEAQKIGMVDAVFGREDYYEQLHTYALSKYDDDFLWEKQEYLEAHEACIEACKEEELRVMYPEFWEKESIFHKLRREFVYKICPTETPKRFNHGR